MGAEPFPLTVTFPLLGEVSRLQAREEALVSESVALSSLAVQVAFVSSSRVLLIGPAPWVITGDCLLSAWIETAKASRLPKLVKSVFPKVAV